MPKQQKDATMGIESKISRQCRILNKKVLFSRKINSQKWKGYGTFEEANDEANEYYLTSIWLITQ